MSRKLSKRMILSIVLVLIAAVVLSLLFAGESKAPQAPRSNQSNTTSNAASESPRFNKSMYKLDEPASPWVVVNKKRPLPASYAPNDLQTASGIQLSAPAATALTQLLAGASRSGVALHGISGYRSYASQQNVYNSYVTKDGRAAADTYSARPGFSEHQTGLAADLGNDTCDLEICFADTPSGKWLAEHAQDYGFIVRYPAGKTNVTGYQYEPWHVRYVGVELANELHKSGQTLEEFFDLPDAPSY